MYIQEYCEIKNGQLHLNGQLHFKGDSTTFASFAREAYRHFALNYPKFFKMDALSKLALLAAESLVTPETDTALVFANRSGSLDTDIAHLSTIVDRSNYYPSPAHFVYTLPNICLGEISIKYKLYSENSFFVFESFPFAFFVKYVKALLDAGKAETVLCGWVEVLGEEYRAFVYRVGREGQVAHTEENLKRMI